MKRPNRNVSEETAYEFLKQVRVGALSMIDGDGMPYVTPVHAVYSPEDDCLYFHCAPEGRRWEALHKNPAVCYVAVTSYEVVPSHFTTLYDSVMVHGHVEFIEDAEEKRRTLIQMTETLVPGQLAQRPQVVDAFSGVMEMIRIKIDSITAKTKSDM